MHSYAEQAHASSNHSDTESAVIDTLVRIVQSLSKREEKRITSKEVDQLLVHPLREKMRAAQLQQLWMRSVEQQLLFCIALDSFEQFRVATAVASSTGKCLSE